tara:strand:+ start:2457 stop:2579 length:123 start_codon:yes stop_codon:yes gene_type:complete
MTIDIIDIIENELNKCKNKEEENFIINMIKARFNLKEIKK